LWVTALVLGLTAPGRSNAQTLILTNYNRHPVGDQAGLQGGAVVARVADSSAPWYNPAGLASITQGTFSGNATVYEASQFSIGGQALYLNTGSSANFLGYALESDAEENKGAQPQGTWGVAFASPINFSSAYGISTKNGQAGVLQPGPPTNVLMVQTNTDEDASGSISLLTGSLGKGWHTASGLSLGIAVEMGLLTINSRENASARQPANVYPNVELEQQQFFYGSENIVRLAAGLQFDPAPGWRVGATLKSQSLTWSDTAALRKQSLQAQDISANNLPPASGRQTDSTFFADYRARFNYVLPTEAHFGAAWVQPGAEWEFDVHYYDAVPTYTFFKSGSLATDTTATGQNLATVTSSTRFSRETNSAQAVTNVALGGRVRVTERGWWNVGVYTDQSPRNTASVISASMDLIGVTTGLSIVREKSSTTLGIIALHGATNNFQTTNFFDNTLKNSYGRAELNSLAAFVSGSLQF
jgi:hypothetical protein